jgi:hypothetical protein
MRWSSVVTAFPDARGPSQYSCKGGIRLSMLPGFRFLFVAIVLSMSILIFGLGAAALLRAAHEEFVSAPSWRAVPETMFAQQSDATRPVLATLSVAPPVTGQNKAPDDVPAATAEPATVAPPASPEPAAALMRDDLSLPEPAKLESRHADTPVPSAAVPAPDDVPAAAEAANKAAPEAILPPPSEAAPASAEQANAPSQTEKTGASTAVEQTSVPAPAEQMNAPAPAEQANAPAPAEQANAPAPAEQASARAPNPAPAPATEAAPMKVVTLGSPSVSLEPAAKGAVRRAHIHSVDNKHQLAARLTHRRRIAQRTHVNAATPAQPATQFNMPSSFYYSVPPGGSGG